MSCDPNDLTELAKCFQCLDEKTAMAVELYLLSVIAGVDPNPSALVTASAAFQGLDPQQSASVQTYLLCQINEANQP